MIKGIRRRTRKKYSSEEKIRIVIDGLRGEDRIFSLCRREGITANLYYRWSKDFLEAGKSVSWVIRPEKLATMKWYLNKENEHLKQLVAEIALKNRVLKKSLNGSDFENINL
jgi:transposase